MPSLGPFALREFYNNYRGSFSVCLKEDAMVIFSGPRLATSYSESPMQNDSVGLSMVGKAISPLYK